MIFIYTYMYVRFTIRIIYIHQPNVPYVINKGFVIIIIIIIHNIYIL